MQIYLQCKIYLYVNLIKKVSIGQCADSANIQKRIKNCKNQIKQLKEVLAGQLQVQQQMDGQDRQIEGLILDLDSKAELDKQKTLTADLMRKQLEGRANKVSQKALTAMQHNSSKGKEQTVKLREIIESQSQMVTQIQEFKQKTYFEE